MNLILVGGFTVAYCAGAVMLTFRVRPDPLSVEALAFGVTAAIVALTFALVLLYGTLDYSRLILVSSSALVVVGLTMPMIAARGLVSTAAAVGSIVIMVAVGYVGWKWLAPDSGLPRVRTAIVKASRHTLIATYFSDYVPAEPGPGTSGGAITSLGAEGSTYLLATADGRLYRINFPSDDEIEVKSLRARVPLNLADFVADVGAGVSPYGFRVADIKVRTDDNGLTLYASHHFWKRQQACFVVRVSALTVKSVQDIDAIDDSGHDRWSTIFETSPCLPIEKGRGSSFAGEQMGGNLEIQGNDLILTVGDHQFDGWYHEANYVQDEHASYGKTFRINLASHAARVMTVGHRNPQGLLVDSANRVWETEHGPQGGDELNLLRDGANYGYPYHTYGTEYGSVVWPASNDAALARIHAVLPTFAWVPSIGISDLIQIDDPAFPRWKDDLLVSSLTGRSLWRVHLRPDEPMVAYAEPIPIGKRIRDVASAGRGDIVLWTDDRTLVRLTSAESVDAGSAIFAVRCGGCHDDSEHRIGPQLKELFSRGIAKVDGYEFSAALSGVGGKWSDAKLDRFLASPSTFAPGTRMTVSLEDKLARKRVIEYLHTLN